MCTKITLKCSPFSQILMLYGFFHLLVKFCHVHVISVTLKVKMKRRFTLTKGILFEMQSGYYIFCDAVFKLLLSNVLDENSYTMYTLFDLHVQN